MMTDAQIITAILVHEGSAYTNDAADAGGPTKYGITLKNLSTWRAHRCTAADVEALTQAEAESIYSAEYLRPFDELPDPLRLTVIDMGVNAGVSRATRLLQQMVGVTVDGLIGPATRAAMGQDVDWNALYCGFRLAFYEQLIETKPLNLKWRNGWRRRALSFLRVTR